MTQHEGLTIICALVVYYILGAIINGLMHRFFPDAFPDDSIDMALNVVGWIGIVPLFLFVEFCKKCISWFEKKN